MSRRLPTCAWCGLHGPQVLVRCHGLPGEPVVGWHANDACTLDHLLAELRSGAASDVAEGHVRTIQTRGEDRVSARRAWHDHLRLTSVRGWSVPFGSDPGHIVLRADGDWVHTACGSYQTSAWSTTLPARRCRACVARLHRGELVPA